VLKERGVAAILEFSNPTVFPVKQLYGFYFRRLLPVAGKWISKDSRAYTYLPESVGAFPDGHNFIKILEECGYSNISSHRLLFGIASIYIAEK
jgi:demethylmenaquinone methyltransferase/2-methoxy-6-polyprenyl-1,4-benzoquinol methylase